MGVAERKLREKERRRSDILDAAEELFFEQGLLQTTMDDLAARTELSKGTLYLYFRSKDEVYLAINVRAKRLMREQLQQAVDPRASGLEQVLALGHAYLGFSLEYPDYAAVIQSCQLSEGEQLDSSVYAREAHEHGEKCLEQLILALRKGQADGSIRPKLEIVKTALLLWAQLSGLLQLVAAKGAYLKAKVGEDEQSLTAYVFVLMRSLIAS